MVFLVFSIIAKTAAQKAQGVTRGGRLTVLGSGGATELDINAGGLLNYIVPLGKRAIIKGSINVTVWGANTSLDVEVFDNSSGRLIPVLHLINVAGVLVGGTFELEVSHVVGALRSEIQVHGDNGANNGTAEWIASVQEIPI